MDKRELAAFLRGRRESLVPAEVGLPEGHRRRTPGLRREEVALLAGVSVNYYERLEQARAPRPSPQVADALARALRLSPVEREHLARLAGHLAAPPEEPVPDAVRTLLDRLDEPAYALDAKHDVVAWNAAAALLITDFARAPERNALRLAMRTGVCSAPDGDFARQAASDLRRAAVRHPDDPEPAALASAVAAVDPAFADGWRSHDVRSRPVLRKRIHHLELGTIDVDCHLLAVPGHEVRIVVCTAEEGSPSAAKLARLAGRQPE